MKTMHSYGLPGFPRKILNACLLVCMGWVSFRSPAASQVNFTLGVNTTVDSGLAYTEHTAGDSGPESRFVIGFEIQINSVNNTPLDVSTLAAFCSEIQEPISTQTYTFDAAPLRGLAAGRAGEAGTASTGIAAGGIGDLRAARLSYLFDQQYISSDLTAWVRQDLHAFQLAVWEITHDDDLDLTDPTGISHIGSQSTSDEPVFGQDSVNLAQGWLSDLSNAGIAESYQSSKFDFWALTSTTGNDGIGFQDVILATDKTAPDSETFNEYIVVPEPALLLWCLPALAAAMVMGRRRSGSGN